LTANLTIPADVTVIAADKTIALASHTLTIAGTLTTAQTGSFWETFTGEGSVVVTGSLEQGADTWGIGTEREFVLSSGGSITYDGTDVSIAGPVTAYPKGTGNVFEWTKKHIVASGVLTLGASGSLISELELAEGTLNVGAFTVTVDTDGSVTLAENAEAAITGTGGITLGEADGSLLTVTTDQTLDVTDTVLTGKVTNTAPAIAVTGGTLNLKGTAKVTGNKITVGNSATQQGSGIKVSGAGILNLADNSEVSGNELATASANTGDTGLFYGAGISASGTSTVTIGRDATVTGNKITGTSAATNAHGYGAGIYFGGTTLTLNGTISGNSIEFASNASGDRKAFGAGLAVYGSGTITVGGTITGNTITIDGTGGAYYPVKGIHFFTGATTVTLTTDAVIGADQEILLVGNGSTATSVLKVPTGWANTSGAEKVKLVYRSTGDSNGNGIASAVGAILVTKASAALVEGDIAKFQYWAYAYDQGYGPVAGNATAYKLAVTNENLTVAVAD
jgi:hypothetical protein